MGMFDGVNEAQAPSNAAQKLKPGRYPVLTVLGCKGKVGQKDPSAAYYIVTLKVDADPVQTEKEEPTRRGAVVDWIVNVKDRFGMGKRDAKAFACAVLGDSEAQDVEGDLEASLTGGFNGKAVSGNVFTKDNGYTATRFSPAEVSAVPAAPPAPAVEDDGGPWFPFPSPDPRGTHYNAKGEIKTL